MPDSSDISYLACHWLDFSGHCVISWNLKSVKPDSVRLSVANGPVWAMLHCISWSPPPLAQHHCMRLLTWKGVPSPCAWQSVLFTWITFAMPWPHQSKWNVACLGHFVILLMCVLSLPVCWACCMSSTSTFNNACRNPRPFTSFFMMQTCIGRVDATPSTFQN